MKNLFLFTLILISCQCKSQRLSDRIDVIANENIIECKYIGFGGSESELYNHFEIIKNTASQQELFDLLGHDSLAVVGYSVYALLDRELVEPVKLLERFINENESIVSFCGCLMEEQPISVLLYERVLYNKLLPIDSDRFVSLDSLILNNTESNSRLIDMALENRTFNESFNSRILELAFEEGNFSALSYIYFNLKNGNELRLTEYLEKLIKSENPQYNRNKALDLYQRLKEEIDK